MFAKLIQIGNSQGLRLPKVILEQCGFGKMVELFVEGETLVIKPVRSVREGWADAFKHMAENGDDNVIWEDEGTMLNEFDETEWTW